MDLDKEELEATKKLHKCDKSVKGTGKIIKGVNEKGTILKEDIKILEEIISEPKYYFNNNLRFDAIQIKCKSIENLIKAYKELEEDNKKLTDEYMIQKYLINADFLDDYIPKSLVKEKIEEYKKYCFDNVVEVLEELLEKG